MNETDAVLASRAARGDPAAAEELARQHGPAAFRVARSLGLDEHDAEDTAQDVLLRMLAVLGRYDPDRSSLGTLVYRMTANAVADLRRKRAGSPGRAEAHSILAAPAGRAETASAPSYGPGEVRGAVLAAARDLPERQRQVFVLHDLEELSIAATAAALEITETNARVHLCCARRALRQRLAHLLEG